MFSKGYSSLFLYFFTSLFLHSYCFSFSAKIFLLWLVKMELLICHTTIADFKDIFMKYLIEFMAFWEMPPNWFQELLSNIAFYFVRRWRIKLNYLLILSFLFFLTMFIYFFSDIFKFCMKSTFFQGFLIQEFNHKVKVLFAIN